MKNCKYKIVEGTPSHVAMVCNDLAAIGWVTNGECVIFKNNDNITAFQCMISGTIKPT